MINCPKQKASRPALQKAQLEGQLAEFELKYRLGSAEFYEKFERGEMGDTVDFVEWAATYEMVKELERQLSVLRG